MAFLPGSYLVYPLVLSKMPAPLLGNVRFPVRQDIWCLLDCAGLCADEASSSGGGSRPKWHVENRHLTGAINFQKAAPFHTYKSSDGLTNYTARTKAVSGVEADRLRYAQIFGHNAKSRSYRTPGVPYFCTLFKNADMVTPGHWVRLYQSQSSSTEPQSRPAQAARDQTRSHQAGDPDAAQLTHTDSQGSAAMVDVGGKVPTRRVALARATVLLGPTAFRLLRDNQLAKGDALAVAQLAGIMAAKQTSALIPLCHPLPLDHASVTFDLDGSQNAAVVTATCRTTGRTGVEMEALTAASVAALTLYDMCKAVSHDISIADIHLVSKTGGKRDFQRAP